MSDEEDYEERRSKNIRQNQALLAELDLKAAAEGLGLPPPHKSGAGKRKGRSSSAGYKPHRETVEAKVSPPRQSTRVAEKQRLAELKVKREREEEEAFELARSAKRDLATSGERTLTQVKIEPLHDLPGNPSPPIDNLRFQSQVKLEQDQSEAGSSTVLAPVKRGPGRPRKYLGPVNVVNGTTAEELPKRKRGRPPRIRTAEELEKIAAKAAMPKRPRGRPRKVRPEDAQQLYQQQQSSTVDSIALTVSSVASTAVAESSDAVHAA